MIQKWKKKRKWISVLVVGVMVCGICFIAIGMSLLIEWIVRSYVVPEEEKTWVAALPSYWGAILGGLVSGVFTFGGVYFTIRYYKRTDSEKERKSVQPFLFVEINFDERRNPLIGFSLGDDEVGKAEQKEIRIAIHNIGNGFANTLRIYTGVNDEGIEYNRVIPVNESTYTYFVAKEGRVNDGLPFCLHFLDSMGNEYSQEYLIHRHHSSIEIDCGYPCLVEK